MRPGAVPTVLAVADAIALFGEGHVRWMVASGRWQRPVRGAIVRHSGPLSHGDRLWCELLARSPRAALAGLTAAALDGLKNFETKTVFLLVPRGSSTRSQDGVVVRSSVRLRPADLHPAREPRRTRPARSIVDAASWAATDLKAQAIMASAVQQGLVRPEDLAAVVDGLLKVPRRQLILETIRDVSGGALSEYEILFARLCRRYALPTPSRQRRRKDAAGRWRYLDTDFDVHHLTVEIDGQQHMEALSWWEDMSRTNELVADEDRRVMRFAGFALRRQPEQVSQVLLRYFARGRR
jgi:hypothetical protein